MTFRSTLLALAVMTSSVIAQEPAVMKTTIVTYAPGKLPDGFKAFFMSGKEIKPFTAAEGTMGDAVRYEGPRRLVLRESEDAFAAAATPGQEKPPLAVVDLPANSDNVLLLVADAGGGRVRLIPYDVASQNLRAGDYRFFNFSRSDLSVILGSQRFTIASREDKVIKDAWNKQIVAVEFKIATVNGNQAKLVKESMWEHWPDKRNIIFFFDGRRKGESIGMMIFNLGAPLKDKAAAQAQP